MAEGPGSAIHAYLFPPLPAATGRVSVRKKFRISMTGFDLAQVYSVLAWYHANRREVDADIFREESEYERLAAEHSRPDKCA